ncbi:hypothetical protein LK533_15285 [Sphingomonas sp. PL-96]|uniref:hypothetical protein n=1 Tax=Sphingomonas sp. PL-96 TaxID=2887201 RepID=UPI001E2B813A|nr:hypothetical protein [Sphingomonas sp. PL-96]MCC2978027.1 hypothetical protein [Sphingomonas sp. PL-96]
MTGERRRAALLMAAIGLTLSVLCGWLLAESVAASLTAWRAGAPEVRISGGDFGMFALMPILVALAVWGTLALFREDAAVRRIGNGIAVAAMIAVPVALGGSWVLQDIAERRLAAEGYVRCRTERAGRFPSLTLCARKVPPAKLAPGARDAANAIPQTDALPRSTQINQNTARLPT